MVESTDTCVSTQNVANMSADMSATQPKMVSAEVLTKSRRHVAYGYVGNMSAENLLTKILLLHVSMPLRQYASTPLRHYAIRPLCHYAITPLRHYTSTPIRQYASTPVRQYTSTPVRQHTSMPVRQYASMPLRHYAITPVHQYPSTPCYLSCIMQSGGACTTVLSM
jgi:hypothetical protein